MFSDYHKQIQVKNIFLFFTCLKINLKMYEQEQVCPSGRILLICLIFSLWHCRTVSILFHAEHAQVIEFLLNISIAMSHVSYMFKCISWQDYKWIRWELIFNDYTCDEFSRRWQGKIKCGYKLYVDKVVISCSGCKSWI